MKSQEINSQFGQTLAYQNAKTNGNIGKLISEDFREQQGSCKKTVGLYHILTPTTWPIYCQTPTPSSSRPKIFRCWSHKSKGQPLPSSLQTPNAQMPIKPVRRTGMLKQDNLTTVILRLLHTTHSTASCTRTSTPVSWMSEFFVH